MSGLVLVPYAQAEVFYDSRSGEWDRQLYQAGVEIRGTGGSSRPTRDRKDQRSRPAHLDRIGLVFKLYRLGWLVT